MLVRSFAGPDDGDGDADADDGCHGHPGGEAGGGDSERSRSWGNGPLRADDHRADGAALPWSGPSLAAPSVEGGEARQSGQPSAPEAWSLGRSVALLEGASLAVAVTAHAACQRAARRQTVEAVGSTVLERKHPAQVLGWLTTLQVLPLWIAVGANALLRLHSEHLSSTGQGSPQPGARLASEMPLLERVGVLEVELVNTMKVGQALSRQLEKLSTRFRVTRMTLRDSLEETAKLAQRTSNSAEGLAAGSERLNSELQELQFAMLAMQEQHSKHLKLFSSTAARLLQSQRSVEQKLRDWKS
eukprot:SM000188S03802  [mRNA]  locus=s188:32852:34457:- [translate_table: standard]